VDVHGHVPSKNRQRQRELSASLRGKTSMPTGNILTVLESKIIHGKNTAKRTETAH